MPVCKTLKTLVVDNDDGDDGNYGKYNNGCSSDDGDMIMMPMIVITLTRHTPLHLASQLAQLHHSAFYTITSMTTAMM